AKPLLALAQGPFPVLGARFIDRIGKGLRGAPRDALVADLTPPELRGRAYGLRQALDTVGALVGPLLAIGLMMAFAGDMRAVFAWAIVPGVIAVALVVFGIEGAGRSAAPGPARVPLRVSDLRQLPAAFWAVTGIGVIFTLARFSEAFLVLRAHDAGLPIALAPLVLVVMNTVYSAGAYPAGALSDRIGTHRLMLASLASLIAADLLLAFAGGLPTVFAGLGLWGLHMALSQGLLAKLIAQHSPQAMRGSAFGLFNLASGLALLVASVLAGLLWDHGGAAWTFLAGAGFAATAAAGLVALRGTLARG
ncbi:MAG: hypothetical protein RL339_426, partial [Pseudomonadota bacterium]